MLELNIFESFSTHEFAKLFGVVDQTVRKNYCKNGHCYGVVPVKAPNRLLRWPKHKAIQAFNGDLQANS